MISAQNRAAEKMRRKSPRVTSLTTAADESTSHISKETSRSLINSLCNNESERNAMITAGSFFLVFAAFNSAANFATSADPHVGSTSLSLLYGMFTITNFMAPPIVARFSPKYVMFWGALAYPMYVAANIEIVPIVLYIASCILGFGAGCLWVAQQVFIQDCSNHFEQENNLSINSRLGYFNGLFFMGFLFNRFAGNITVALVFEFDQSISFMYILLALICFAGCFGFLTLKSFPKLDTRADGADAAEEMEPLSGKQRDTTQDLEASAKSVESNSNIEPNAGCVATVVSSVMKTVSVWKEANFLRYLLIFTVFSGTSQEFAVGEFPVLITNKTFKFGSLALYGLMSGIFSITFGKLSDNPKYGRAFVLYICAAAHFLFYVICYCYQSFLVAYEDDWAHWRMLAFLAVLLGMGDAGMLGQLAAVYPCLLGKTPQVFATLKFWQSLSTAVLFAAHSSLTYESKVLFNLALVIFGYGPLLMSKKMKHLLATGSDSH